MEKFKERYKKNNLECQKKSRENYKQNRQEYLKSFSERYRNKRTEHTQKISKRYYNNHQLFKLKRLQEYRKKIDANRSYFRQYYLEKKEQMTETRLRNRKYKKTRLEEFRKTKNTNNAPGSTLSRPRRVKHARLFPLRGHKEKWIKTLMTKLKGTSIASRRIQAEELIKWGLKYRTVQLHLFGSSFEELKRKSLSLLEKIGTETNVSSEDILGAGEHSVHTELYYLDPIYRPLPADKTYELNDQGIVMNLLDVTKKKTWRCNPHVCDNEFDATRMKTIMTSIANIRDDDICDIRQFLQHFDLCSSEYSDPGKLGHPISCHTLKNCISQLLYLRHLSPHFLLIRQFLTTFYNTRRSVNNMDSINSAIQNCQISTLEQIALDFKAKGQEFQVGSVTFQNEDEIKTRYKSAFEILTKKSQDLPTHPCLSCERLCYRRDTTEISKMKVLPKCDEWKRLMEYAQTNGISQEYICHNCLLKFRGNKLPASCVLNDLESRALPPEIACLNSYEKLLIQRAKAFQTVVRMGSVSGQSRPNLLQKVVGRTFHLPLPIEETIKKLPNPADPIIRQQELFVTIRGLPNKSKKIWQSNVDINKLYAALRWLQDHNPLYKDIQLESASDIQRHIERLDSDDLIVHEERDEDDDGQPVNNSRNEQPAMLTQRNPEDEYYDQYTIQALEGSRQNDTCTNLYQMLKVQGDPIDFRCTDLELRCFPDLLSLWIERSICDQASSSDAI
uniref:DUF6570 domain-containing protein n=1 Tax=Cacopsylla melanoneura TaxID=428564 RepID=A0A8D8LG92_9HEMI